MVTATETPAATGPSPLTSPPGAVPAPPASGASWFATRNGTAFDFCRGRRPDELRIGQRAAGGGSVMTATRSKCRYRAGDSGRSR